MDEYLKEIDKYDGQHTEMRKRRQSENFDIQMDYSPMEPPYSVEQRMAERLAEISAEPGIRRREWWYQASKKVTWLFLVSPFVSFAVAGVLGLIYGSPPFLADWMLLIDPFWALIFSYYWPTLVLAAIVIICYREMSRNDWE